MSFLTLSASGHCAPIGTHLVLHDKPNADKIPLDGEALGRLFVETAERFGTSLAVPLMDLAIEKAALLGQLGVPENEIETFHFAAPPADPGPPRLTPRMKTVCEALTHVAAQPGLISCGMGIGPFSLMTKLVADPITPIYLAGMGMTGEDEPEVAVAERCLELGLRLILAYVEAQCDAGAKAFYMCEPAANIVYFSPKQLEETDYAVFEKFVMAPVREIAALLRRKGVEFVFHNCGELTDEMVRRFGTLDISVLSLGSSRKLWEDAALIPKNIVLYGNLPTKRFYSPALPVAEVTHIAEDLVAKMTETRHPFILGSECDILAVPGAEHEILPKVEALLAVGRKMKKD
ncbi:MAG: uroporphyrinogen decarboxylase family protein [Kiritimatiellaeota bacterium]|nr:uroporphyrinogen decarboxylase family protein [Kiritimatiellota bacterium]